MNRAYLRPPLPLFRVAAVLTLPLMLWGGYEIALSRLSPLQKMYWGDYLSSTFVPSLPDLFPTFGPTAKTKQQLQVLLCVGPNGAEMPITKKFEGAAAQPDAHLAAVPMSNEEFGKWLRKDIYVGRPVVVYLLPPIMLSMMFVAMLAGGAYFLDQERHLKFRQEPRYISGPRLVTPSEFRRLVKGDGLAFYAERRWRKPEAVRIERSVEAQHQLMQGDNGAGKTVAMMALADQAEAAGDTCIFYDPECQFLKRYWKPGDLILGPDARSASWGPCSEIDYSSVANADASAMALGESLYPCRPGEKNFFFYHCARLIFKHCTTNYRPTAAELAELYTHADPLIDAMAKGTELEEMLRKNTQGLRASVISTLTQCLFALQQVPGEEADRPKFSAKEYVAMKGRRPAIFLTSGDEKMQVAFSPLHRMWIDSLIREFLSLPEVAPGEITVRMFIDEMPVLGELASLKAVTARGRKHGIDLCMGFQGRSQIKALYGEESEQIFSAPFTKLLLHTGEPEGGEWASKMLGDQEVEKIVEHLSAERKRTYTTQPVPQHRIVTQSELASLKNRHGYLRYEGYIVKVKLAIPPTRPARCVGFVPRTGVAPVQLPMPNLAQIRAAEAAEKAANAAKAAAKPYAPPAA
jgi:hypothetical protein